MKIARKNQLLNNGANLAQSVSDKKLTQNDLTLIQIGFRFASMTESQQKRVLKVLDLVFDEKFEPLN